MSETNRYPAKCYRCGGRVEAEKGIMTFESMPALRWKQAKFQHNWTLVEHPDCAARYAGTNHHYFYEVTDEGS